MYQYQFLDLLHFMRPMSLCIQSNFYAGMNIFQQNTFRKLEPVNEKQISVIFVILTIDFGTNDHWVMANTISLLHKYFMIAAVKPK